MLALTCTINGTAYVGEKCAYSFLGAIFVLFFVVFVVHLLCRRRLKPYLNALSARSFFDVFWFRHQNATAVVVLERPYGARSLKRALELTKKNRFITGRNPLLNIYIPVKNKHSWFIQVVATTGLGSQALALNVLADEGIWAGQRFQYSASDEAMKTRIKVSMTTVGPKLLQLAENQSAAVLVSHYKVLVHNGFPRWGRYVSYPLPEGLEQNPELIRDQVDGVLEILHELDVEPKLYKQ